MTRSCLTLSPQQYHYALETMRRAEKEGRNVLLEHEVYALLAKMGMGRPPQAVLLSDQQQLEEVLQNFSGEKVVLKIASADIIHKTDVGGVKIVRNDLQTVKEAVAQMLQESMTRFCDDLITYPDHMPAVLKGLNPEQLREKVRAHIKGVLIVEFTPPDSPAIGYEIIAGIRNTEEFGMVASAGLGGVDTELLAANMLKHKALALASTALSSPAEFLDLFAQTIAYKKISGQTRGNKRLLEDQVLLDCFQGLFALANSFSPDNSEAEFIIEEFEINPFAISSGFLTPLDGMCRFSVKKADNKNPRPVEKIHRLLHPENIGVMGVSSTRVNFGRIILRNIMANGYDKNKITIIKPDEAQIDGVRCVPTLATMDHRIDLLVLAVGAEQVPEILEDILEQGNVESVLLIPGGLGEKKGSEERAARIMARINEAHGQKDGGPIFLGANSIGVLSYPGRYDTMFIPEQKLPKNHENYSRPGAFISQSGAFIVTRMSKAPAMDPAYQVSMGNQNDLTLGDMLAYLKDLPDIKVIAVYAEGFKPLDGLAFCRAVRSAVLAGKDVVFYKAGRTPEGKTAASGHTASLAGDYLVCESLVHQAGGMVAQTFSQFEDLFLIAQKLFDKKINGNRVAMASGAGFEAVGMADNLAGEFPLKAAVFLPETIKKVEEIIKANKLDDLVDVRNPLDMNPTASDLTHVEIAKAMLADPGVDALVLGLDPLSPVTFTLAEDLDNPLSQLTLLDNAKFEKPLLGLIEGGRLYDAFAQGMLKAGYPLFRATNKAMATLGQYLDGKLRGQKIRREHQQYER